MGGATAEDPFEITAQSPAPGDENMWLRQPIDITFSHDVDADTVSADAVKVFAGDEELAVEVSLLDDERTVRVLLEEVPTAPVELSVSVSSDVTSADGEAVEETEWSVTAPEWVHLPPVSRGEAPLAELPALAVDGEGNVVVSWSERHPDFADRSNLYVSRWTADGWEHLGERISESGRARGKQLSLKPSGEPVLSYFDPRSSDGDKVHVDAWDGAGWQNVGGALSHYTGVLRMGHDMAVDASGNPVAVWSEFLEGYGILLFLKRWTGSEWSPLDRVRAHPESNSTSVLDLVVDSAGRAVVVFNDNADGEGLETKAYVSAVPANGAVEEFGVLHDTTRSIFHGKVAVDEDDHPWVAYTLSGGDQESESLVKYWDGDSWVAAGEPLDAVEGEDTPAIEPQIVFDSTGAAVIAWAEGDATHLRRWDGSAWEPVGSGTIDVGGVFAIDPFDGPVLASLTGNLEEVQVVRMNR